MVAEGAKRSPELIQLLELHTQFASITSYAQVQEKSQATCTPAFSGRTYLRRQLLPERGILFM